MNAKKNWQTPGRSVRTMLLAGGISLLGSCAATGSQPTPPESIPSPTTAARPPGATQIPDIDPVRFRSWLAEIRQDAIQQGIRETVVDEAFRGIQPLRRVIELDRRQPEFTLTFEQYLARTVSAARVARGRELLRENRELLAEISRSRGVQPRFIVALWGIETDFGRVTGGFYVVEALATLAFEGRRANYFRTELMLALQVINEGHIASKDMRGSWAGAMGQSQFMPSSFVNYAVDHDGDGRRDIWTTKSDVLASIANYLAQIGWRDDQNWGREIRLPADVEPQSIAGTRSLAEWQALGVRRTDGGPLPRRDVNAQLVQTEGDRKRAFLVYDNYRAILKWNRSTFFALAVGLLADQLDGV
jgi:membrane-bound lytic murein transglycosylase B